MPFMYYGYGFVLIGFLIALLAQWNVQSTYSKYKIPVNIESVAQEETK